MKSFICFLSIVLLANLAEAQESTPPDSTVLNTEPTLEEELAKQYERFKPPIDTTSGLVTYKAFVDQAETSWDSFYVRAKKWGQRKYNFELNKTLVLLDKPNEKVVWKGHFESYTSTGKYNKVYTGTITFIITLIFMSEKYKYIIDNIYWEPPPPATKGEEKLHAKDTYAELHIPIEYYLTAKTRVMVKDNKLRCADIEFQALILDLKKSLKNPIQFDDEEF